MLCNVLPPDGSYPEREEKKEKHGQKMKSAELSNASGKLGGFDFPG